MKKNFLGALTLCAMLVSCSSDDPVVNNGNSGDGDGEGSYISFNIVTTKDATRAETGDFELGTAEESYAKKAVFLFFNANGEPTQTPVEQDLEWQTTDDGNYLTSTNPNVERISKATVVIAGNTAPTQVLVILNPMDGVYNHVYGKTLLDVRDISRPYTIELDATTGKPTPGSFTMSNSVYLDESNEEVCTTNIANTAEVRKTFKTASEAEKNPVDIYVERINSKVVVSAEPENFAQGADLPFSGEAEKTHLTQEIEGVMIANTVEKAYTFKSIYGRDRDDWNSQWNKWNDFANRRSYWEYTPSTTFINYSWNATSGKGKTSKDPENIVAYQDGAAHSFYIQPNTNTLTKTALLFTATLKKDGQPFTFLKWGGSYYPKEGFLKQYAQILKNAGYYVQEGTDVSTYRSIKPEELDWLTPEEHSNYVDTKKLQGYEMTAKIKDSSELRLVKSRQNNEGNKGYDAVTANDINLFLMDKGNRVWIWEGGKCYYFVNIEHFGPDNTNTNLTEDTPDQAASEPSKINFHEGVVRNHIYDLTLESLKGPGTPVYNPEEIIIPEKPSDDLYYLGARVNILKWKYVNQKVNIDY